MLDPELLRQFLSVVDHMNFTRAASDLYISHSTVSRNVSRLEEYFGVKLLLRDNRVLSLTPAGQHLAERSRALLADIELLEQEMGQFTQETRPHLHVASFNFFNNEIFRGYEQFHRDWPEVDMSIQYHTLGELQRAVAQGDADIGITLSFALDKGSKFETLTLLEGEFVVLVAANHPLAQLGSIDISDPRLEQPIMMSAVDYSFVASLGAEAAFNRSGKPPRKVTSIDSFVLQIKAGMGIGLIPEHVATQVGSGCSLLSLDGVDSTYQLQLFWLKSAETAEVRRFVDLFRKDERLPDPASQPD